MSALKWAAGAVSNSPAAGGVKYWSAVVWNWSLAATLQIACAAKPRSSTDAAWSAAHGEGKAGSYHRELAGFTAGRKLGQTLV